MARDDGRLATHFGKPYMWIVNQRGRLELVALSAVAETARAVADVLKSPVPPGAPQPNTWAVKR